jgi:hypothetical protein
MKDVCWLALGMFAWGAFKACALGKTVAEGCPICAAEQVRSPKHLFHSLALGPVMEEMTYRRNLPKLIGPTASAALFGAGHRSKRLSPTGNFLRVLEAGLAGGVVYAEAYERSGLAGAALVHAAHNLGADLALGHVLDQRVREEGWVREHKPIQLNVAGRTIHGTTSACRKLGKPLKGCYAQA